jgi:hypothetical protein
MYTGLMDVKFTPERRSRSSVSSLPYREKFTRKQQQRQQQQQQQDRGTFVGKD